MCVCVCTNVHVCKGVCIPKQLPFPSRPSAGAKEWIQVASTKSPSKTGGFNEVSLQSKKGMPFSNSPCEKITQKDEEIKIPKMIRKEKYHFLIFLFSTSSHF